MIEGRFDLFLGRGVDNTKPHVDFYQPTLIGLTLPYLVMMMMFGDDNNDNDDDDDDDDDVTHIWPSPGN